MKTNEINKVKEQHCFFNRGIKFEYRRRLANISAGVSSKYKGKGQKKSS